jgi:uncharacterized protein
VRSKLLSHEGRATYAIVFDIGDEIISGLTTFAKEHRLEASDFTALGAFSSALLGFFEVEQKEYRKIPIKEQVEVLTLVGNITLDDGEPKVHAHVVLGCADGTTRGGHLRRLRPANPGANALRVSGAAPTPVRCRVRTRPDPPVALPVLSRR